jgi:hypothetical protein
MSLHTVNVNTAAASSTVTLYDNTSAAGPGIAVIDSSAKGSYLYDITLAKGLFVVIAGGTPDVTITFQEQA